MRAGPAPDLDLNRDDALARLIGQPCPMDAMAWHRAHLTAGDATPASAARLRYHQTMLAYTANPAGAERPLVSVVIPVYNRARHLVEAVRSCVAQSWRPIEILVIDDGSTDDPTGALRPFGEAVQVVRQDNAGVSAARNAGIARARGDFVHLLDSDDTLAPNAIARKVAAFAAIPDAGLCFSMIGQRHAPGLSGSKPMPPDGSDECATSDLLLASLRRYPFFTSTVMMPRWTMLMAAPFERDLRRGEDNRYFFMLGLAGIKAIGFDEPLGMRHLVEDALSLAPRTPGEAIDIRLRMTRDLLGVPARWPLVRSIVEFLAPRMKRSVRGDAALIRQLPVFGALVADILALGDGRYRNGHSPLPVLADFRSGIARAGILAHPRWGAAWQALDQAAATAQRSAAPLTLADVEHWGTSRRDPSEPRDAAAKICRMLLKSTRKDPALVPQVDRILRRIHPLPLPDEVRRYRRFRRALRSGWIAGCLTWPSAYLRSAW